MHYVYHLIWKRTLLHLHTDKWSLMYVQAFPRCLLGSFRPTSIISWSQTTTLPQFMEIMKASQPWRSCNSVNSAEVHVKSQNTWQVALLPRYTSPCRTSLITSFPFKPLWSITHIQGTDLNDLWPLCPSFNTKQYKQCSTTTVGPFKKRTDSLSCDQNANVPRTGI